MREFLSSVSSSAGAISVCGSTRSRICCPDRYSTVSADHACAFEGSAVAASSTPKQREGEATVFGDSCSESAEGFEIRASTVVSVG